MHRILRTLHPSLGIHHSNDRNAYRLADDLIEPFRPFVDILVWKLVERGQHEVTSETKSALANVLYKNVSTPAGTSTLWGEILGTTQSYVSCLKKESARLELPLQTFDRFCD
jgi:CRISPR-associated protein Cas1